MLLQYSELEKKKQEVLVETINEHSQDFVKDLQRDLKNREWKKLGKEYEVILHDCPEYTNNEACGPFTCRG